MVKPKPMLPLKPIRKYTDNPMNQSKLEVNTYSWSEVREKVYGELQLVLVLTSD